MPVWLAALQPMTNNALLWRPSLLSDEFDTLEHLHSLKIVSVRPSGLDLVHSTDLKLSIPCEKYIPTSAGAKIEILPSCSKPRRNAALVSLLAALIQEHVASTRFSSAQEVHNSVL